MAEQLFNQKIKELLKLGKAKIAFGMIEPDEEILASLNKVKRYADIILVGSKAIKDIKNFEILVVDNPEKKLANMLVDKEVDGIVRGTIDDFKTHETYTKLTGEPMTLNPGLMEAPNGHQFFLSPASNPEAWDKETRLSIAMGIANFMKEFGLEPKIAIFSGTRHETYERKKDIKEGVTGILNQTYEDAVWITKQLDNKGYNAKNWAIDMNSALEEEYNVIIPVNGMVGNQIFRMCLFSGGKILTCTRMNLSHAYEDNSRTEKDYEFHVKWLVAMINSKK